MPTPNVEKAIASENCPRSANGDLSSSSSSSMNPPSLCCCANGVTGRIDEFPGRSLIGDLPSGVYEPCARLSLLVTPFRTRSLSVRRCDEGVSLRSGVSGGRLKSCMGIKMG